MTSAIVPQPSTMNIPVWRVRFLRRWLPEVEFDEPDIGDTWGATVLEGVRVRVMISLRSSALKRGSPGVCGVFGKGGHDLVSGLPQAEQSFTLPQGETLALRPGADRGQHIGWHQVIRHPRP
ncbi:hypothetical protein [Nonomuraea dietziae]|uniref:Uncharacterized protein n=1 Tax=Nonomuraea dietziae TaxID=65515 RepID=A0A7W5VD18_9ACTN|nr:hypothetical protein [Nonomuraea dietziae]MBB3733844.1 hypothetical protein [Nonomuraea dietziae]